MSAVGPPSRAGGRRALSTGTALSLIAVGAILWFAVSGSAIPDVNVNIVGIILLVIGIIGLLLPVAGPRFQALSPWYRPGGHDSSRLDEMKRAAEADDARVETDDKYFDAYGPGSREDDL
jgi:hypothetical protein